MKCGKYFEVRYFLNVIVGTSHNKLVTVQLPIVLIHINSLDVVPNSVAQVAAAIEEQRANGGRRRSGENDLLGRGHSTNSPASQSSIRVSRRPSSATSVLSRAFAAPRKQSLDRARALAEDLNVLGDLLHESPRRYRISPRRHHGRPSLVHGPRPQPSSSTQRRAQSLPRAQSPAQIYSYQTPPSHRKGRVLSDELGSEVREIRTRLRHMHSTETSRSVISASGTLAPPVHDGFGVSRAYVGRNNSGQSAAGGFRELELDTDDRGRGGLVPPPRPDSTQGTRIDQHRPFHFRKMKSTDRWRGAGSWFGDRSRERERDKEEKQKALMNWI